MATLDGYNQIADGDQLNDGLFNDNWNFNLISNGLLMVDQLILMENASIVETNDRLDSARDYFSDATGYNDTVNTGSSTAEAGSTVYFANLTDGTPEASTAVSKNSSGDWSATCTAINTGIISSVQVGLANPQTVTITIRDSNSNIIAQKSSALGTGNNVITFSSTDYSAMITAGTFTIAGTGGSSDKETATGYSFSGTNFSLSSQEVGAANSGSVSPLEYTPVTAATAVLETDALTSSGNNINSISIVAKKQDNGSDLITYDVSTDNGSTFTTGLSLDRPNAITSTLGNQLIIKFNMPASVEALIKGYYAKFGRV